MGCSTQSERSSREGWDAEASTETAVTSREARRVEDDPLGSPQAGGGQVSHPFHLVEVEQGSDEWLQARCGLLTGSRAPDMLSTRKDKKESAARRDLRLALVCERLTNRPVDGGDVSRDMQRGRELEAAALRAYEARMGVFVKRVGFLRHPTLLAGCSPDGYVGDFKGIVEVKCPRSATHLEYIRYKGRRDRSIADPWLKEVPEEYAGQVMHNLWITGAEYCDFISWDPRFPPHLQMFHVRVERLELMIRSYERTVEAFLDEVSSELVDVMKLMEPAA